MRTRRALLLRRVTVGLLLATAFVPGAEGQPRSIVVCVFNHEAAFFVKPDRIDAAPHRAAGKGFELIFANLDTDEPRLKAQLGEGPLQVIMRRPEAVWLGEPTGGGLNVYTIFRTAGVAMLSKQYYASPLLGDEHVGIIAVGRCR